MQQFVLQIHWYFELVVFIWVISRRSLRKALLRGEFGGFQRSKPKPRSLRGWFCWCGEKDSLMNVSWTFVYGDWIITYIHIYIYIYTHTLIIKCEYINTHIFVCTWASTTIDHGDMIDIWLWMWIHTFSRGFYSIFWAIVRLGKP